MRFPRSAAILIALLAFCASARAQQIYVLPDRIAEQMAADAEAREATQARALAERRQRMIDECEANHGEEEDCVREVDTELRAEAMQTGARVIHLRPAAP